MYIINIDYNKIYESNSNGRFKIIREIGYINNRYMVEIIFIDTGTITTARYDAVLKGTVVDELYGIDFNKIYYSNMYGPFIILNFAGRDKDGRRLVLIRFLATGTEKVITYKAAKYGYAVDHMATCLTPLDTSLLPSEDCENIINRCLKQKWRQIIDRCKNTKNKSFINYGGAGVTIDSSWENYDNFAKDVKEIFQYNKFYRFPFSYSLDKDYLQLNIPKSKRVYSKNTCVFLYKYDNTNLSFIEYRNNHINELSSKYFGVSKNTCGTYRADITINGKKRTIGTFNSEIAAANAFNAQFEKYHQYELIPLYNDVPYMSPLEILECMTHKKELIRIIK